MLRRSKSRNLKSQSGLTLIELMIAMTVLAVGLAGIMAIVVAALYGNSKNRTDTTATMISQMVIEQMADMSSQSNTPFTITDCAGVNWTVSTTAGAVGVPTGATLKGTNGATWVASDIDFNVAQPGVGYFMNYTACSTNGSPGLIYDVRWNLTSTGGGFTKNVVVAARIRGTGATTAGGANNIYFSIPVQLKTVLGT